MSSIGSFCLGEERYCNIDDTDGYDIIVLGGQSNMTGWNPADGYNDRQESTNIYQIGSNGDDNYKIISAKDPLQTPDRPKNSGQCSSIGMTFARLYESRYLCTGRKILLVPCSSGSSSFCCGGAMIDTTHPKDSDIAGYPVVWDLTGYLYENLMRRTKRALACDPRSNTLNTYTPNHTQPRNQKNRVVAFLWHQGEGDNPGPFGGLDYGFVSSNAGYAGKLRQLITNFRSIPGAEDAVFICGGLSPKFVGWGGSPAPIDSIDNWTTPKPLEQVMMNIKTVLPDIRRTGFASSRVPTEAPTEGVGYIHFSGAGYRILGQRYFEQFSNIISSS